MDHYTVEKIMDQFSDVPWSKLSSKHITFPDHDRFLDIAVKFREKWNFSNVIGCIDGSTFALNVLQKLGHCSTITKKFCS